jgi:hypothetical protein
MQREIAIYGVLLPSLLPIFVGSALLYWLLDTGLARYGAYQHLWHPALVRLSLFIGLFVAAAWLLDR